MDRIAEIAVFVRVVELGSFTRAADALEVSKAAVSKQVSRLEQRLGARLLHRTTRRLTLTEAGDALYRRSAGALIELGEAEKEVAQLTGAPRGLLRVSAPVYFGSVSLAPHLAAFRARYPEIALDLELDDRLVDLVKERFDVAVRISAMTDSNLVARRLSPCPLVVVGSPAYFKRHGMPRTPADLAAHTCLTYALARTPNEWRLRPPRGRWIAVTVASSLRSNSDFVLKQGVLDGLGLGMFPNFFVERELAEGRLRQALADCETSAASINVVYASRRQLLPKVRAFVDFMAERFGSGAALR
ncbi:MAG TPA: LysR family transcriptional regulator [Verrucomicrobiae bacterium]|nr:LysR family transcriptional regulator [Verrucomicrobiae bacterium]